MRSPIAVTGAGLVTCLGLDLPTTWKAVRSGRCGIGPMPALEQRPHPDKGGGQAPDLPADFAPDQPREVRYLRWALNEALADATKQANTPLPSDGLGLVLCTTLHGMRSGGRFLRSGDANDLRTFLAGDIAQRLITTGFKPDRVLTTCASCASALSGVGLAMTLLETRCCDAVVVAGYDAVSEYVYAGFNSLRLVAQGPVQPFCKDRQGMKVAEGYAVLVLERPDDARRRHAQPLVQILGHGESSDSHHLTQPHPQGQGAFDAMTTALRRAQLQPEQIGLISAHATATPDNDAAEHAALQRVFGARLHYVPTVAFKAHIGHTLGAAGAVELILTAMALDEQVVPPTPNVTPADVEYSDLDLRSGHNAQPARIGAALQSSLGFGGTNASVVLAPPDGSRKEPIVSASTPFARTSYNNTPAPQLVWITGLGVVLPRAVGRDTLQQLIINNPPSAVTEDTGPIPDDPIGTLINAKRTRRMSQCVKLALAAATLAVRDARFEPSPGGSALQPHNELPKRDPGATSGGGASGGGIVLGTTHGSSSFCAAYYRQIVEEGIDAANPVLFAEGVPNAASAQLSIAMGIHGCGQTIIGSRSAGLEALALAAEKIAVGQWTTALAGATEEYEPLVCDVYRQLLAQHARSSQQGQKNVCASTPPLRFGRGAVLFVLETPQSAHNRGVLPYAVIHRSAAAAGLWPPTHASLTSARRAFAGLKQEHVITSSSYLPQLARLEYAVTRKAPRGRAQDATGQSIDSHFGEMFSVGPLAGIAAAILTNRFFHPDSQSDRVTSGQHSFTAFSSGFDGSCWALELTKLDGRP